MPIVDTMKRSFVIVLALVLLGPGLGQASVLSSAASALSAGSFSSNINGSTGYNFNSDGSSGSIFVPSPEGPACGNNDYITQFADDAGYDQSRGVIRFLGQSHGSAACEAMRFSRYTISTDTWDKSLALPSEFTCIRGFDPSPACLQHEWDNWNAVRASDGLQLALIGTQAIQYNPATNVWSVAGPSGQIHRNAATSLRYFPDMGRWIHCDSDYGCWKLDPASNFANGWTYIAAGSICFGPCPGPQIYDADADHTNSQMTYNNVKGVLYVMTGNVGFWKISSSGVFTKLTNCPVRCALTASVSVVDPVSGQLILIGGNNVMYKYDPDANTWSATGISPPAVFANDSRGSSNGPGDGMIGVALPDLGVIWYAKYTGAGSNGVFIYKHQASSPADTTAPTPPSSLTATAVSSTQIDLAWTPGTDAIGITETLIEQCTPSVCTPSVQVATSTPNTYSVTGLSPSTGYSFRVRHRDAADNRSTYSNTASAATTAATGSSDFTTRCAAAGVVRCFNFDDIAQLGTISTRANFGRFHNASGGAPPADGSTCNTSPRVDECPTIDTTVKASGTGSLKFTMQDLTGSGVGGQWYANASADNSVLWGQNTDFYYQWRQRFDSAWITNLYNNAGSCCADGPKHAIFTQGDLPGCSTGTLANCRNSNTGYDFVMQNVSHRGYAQMYGNLNGNQYYPFEDGGGEFGLAPTLSFQNMRPSPYCLYSQQSGGGGVPFANNFPPNGNCFGYFANEWMTFKVHAHLGPLVGGVYQNSTVEVWIGREGQALVPTSRWVGSMGGNATQPFGKIFLLPYVTNKDSAQTHTTANTWYDELVISTQDIADPSSTPTDVLQGGLKIYGATITGKAQLQ